MKLVFDKKRVLLTDFLSDTSFSKRPIGQLLKVWRQLLETIFQSHLSGNVFDSVSWKPELLLKNGEIHSVQVDEVIYKRPQCDFKRLKNLRNQGFKWEFVYKKPDNSFFGWIKDLTQPTTLTVAHDFAAPESSVDIIDARSNVFTLGLYAAWIFSDFDGNDLEQYQLLIKGEKEHFKWNDARLSDWVMVCLKTDPDHRPSLQQSIALFDQISLDHLQVQTPEGDNKYQQVLYSFRSTLLDYSKRNPLFDLKDRKSDLVLKDLRLPVLFAKGIHWNYGLTSNEAQLHRLHDIRRRRALSIREKGEDTLRLAVCFLDWVDPETQEVIHTPILFAPVSLDFSKSFQFEYRLASTENVLTVNELFRLFLFEQFKIPIPSTVPIGDSYLEEFRQGLITSIQEKGGEIRQWKEQLVLGNFSFANISMASDYDEIIKAPIHNLLSEMIGFGPANHEAEDLPTFSRFEKCWVLGADPSQEVALHQSEHKSLVVEGPPGTGKSQTIVNGIAQAIAKGERVLFVSEKKAALEVVSKRMGAAGLSSLGLLVHDQKAERKEIIDSLKQAYEDFSQPLERDARLGKVLRQRDCEEHLEILDDYFSKVRNREMGYSLNELFLIHAELETRSESIPSELVPGYTEWFAQRDRLERIAKSLNDLELGEIWAETIYPPLNELELSRSPQPQLTYSEALSASINACYSLNTWYQSLKYDGSLTIGDLLQIRSLAKSIKWLIERDLVKLVLDENPKRERFEKLKTDFLDKQSLLDQKRKRRGLSNDVASDIRAIESALIQLDETPENPELKEFMETLSNGETWFKNDWRTILKHHLQTARAEMALQKVAGRIRNEFKSEDPEHFIAQVTLLQDLAQRMRYHLPDFFSWLSERRFPSAILQLWLEQDTVLGELERQAVILHQGFRECSIGELTDFLDLLVQAPPRDELFALLKEINELPPAIKHVLKRAPYSMEALERASVKKEIRRAYIRYPDLEKIKSESLDEMNGKVAHALKQWHTWNAWFLLDERRRLLQENERLVEIPAAKLEEEEKQRKWTFRKGLKQLKHEFDKTRQLKSLRELLHADASVLVEMLKPILMMSPNAVSEVIPCEKELFDLVIFDEASQIRMEEVLPIVYRAKRVMVVGDTRQLPPSSFFRSGNREAETIDGASFNSFLEAAKTCFPSQPLNWHYRSQHPDLVALSNAYFYHGNLSVFPCHPLPKFPLKWTFVEDGVWENRQNIIEARRLVHTFVHHFKSEPEKTFALVAFSETQQNALMRELDHIRSEDPELDTLLDNEETRYNDGAYCGLIVRNLENMQGEERDVLYISCGYGPTPSGKMALNFGPVLHEGGDRRLNVLFTRSKTEMHCFTSFKPQGLADSTNPSLFFLRKFLEYTEASNAGDEVKKASIEALLLGKYQDNNANSADLDHVLLKYLPHELHDQPIVQLGKGNDQFMLVKGKKGRGQLVQVEGAEVHTWNDFYVAELLKQRGYSVMHFCIQDVKDAKRSQ